LELNSLRGDVEEGFSTLGSAVERKTDLEYLKGQITDLVKAMARKFADKVQNKKDHLDLEKQIRNLFEMLRAK